MITSDACRSVGIALSTKVNVVIGLEPRAAMIYKQAGNLRAVQIPLGHTRIESRVRYLGVDVEGALTPAERTEI